MSSILDLTKKRDAHVAQRLHDDVIIWFTTVRPDGRPHTAAVWFLWEGETCLIFSKPNQKIRNLQHNSNVLLAIDNTHEGSDPISIEGTATLLKPGEADATLAAYVEKYGERIKGLGWSPEIMSNEYSEAIRIVPTRLL